VVVKKAGEVAGESEASRVRAKPEERAAEDKALSVVLQKEQPSSSAEDLSSFRSGSFPSCSIGAFSTESSASLFG